MSRTAEIARTTKETDIKVRIDLDGTGANNIDTGIGFFDHMLTALSKHSGIDMDITCKGDLKVDAHHSVEDTGIVLGQAVAQALGDKVGIRRYGSASIPMDEALGTAIDQGLLEEQGECLVPTGRGWLLGNELYGLLWGLAPGSVRELSV